MIQSCLADVGNDAADLSSFSSYSFVARDQAAAVDTYNQV